MRHIAFLLFAVSLGSSAVAASAEDAQPTRAWTNCQGGPGIWSDLRLTACTEIIKSAKYSGAELAKLHYYRGNARLMQSDYRKAIDDFNAALELSKNDPDALHEFHCSQSRARRGGAIRADAGFAVHAIACTAFASWVGEGARGARER